MVKLAATLRTPFSFLFAERRTEERVAAYLAREHSRGRCLTDVVCDPYVRNRLSEAEVARLLERPELVHALAEDFTPVGLAAR